LLYQEARPTSLDEIIGNRGVVQSLKGIIEDSDRPHVFLFWGDSGSGKTTLSRILAKNLGATDESIQEINAADVTGIDNIRKIGEESNYSPMFSNTRVIIWDEAHKLSNSSQNCLLKMLEDVPKYQYYILCSTEPDKIIKTVRNRCVTFKTSLLSEAQLEEVINTSWTRLYDEPLDKDYIRYAVKNADGSPRKALLNIEKLVSCDSDKSIKEILKEIEENEQEAFDLAKALVKGNWDNVRTLLNNIEDEPEGYRIVLSNYLASCIKNSKNVNKIEKFVLALSVFTDSVPLASNHKAKLIRMVGEAFLHLHGN